MAKKSEMAHNILDMALLLAERSSWEAVRLYDVAAELNISLQQVKEHYRQKDDLSEAWFDRADGAMLEDAARDDYLQLPPRKRFHRSIISWLNAMAQHRHVTGEMLRYKLEFGHIHLQALGVMRISRTVQWILEAAHRDAVHFERVVEEIVMTTIYLSTFAYWLRDESSDAARTAKFLDTLLRRAENLAFFIPGTRPFIVPHAYKTKQRGSMVEDPEKISKL